MRIMEKQLRLSLLSLLVLLCGNAFATTETITFSELGYESNAELSEITGDYVTLTFSVGTGSTTPKYNTTGSAARLYASNTLTVTASTSITEITFEYSGTTYVPDDSLQTFGVNTGTYDYDSCKWTGDTTELVITNNGTSQWRIQVMTITLADGAKKQANLAFSEDEIELTLGDEFTSPTFTYDTDATITFSSDNEEVATVDTTGVITLAGGTGTAVISAVCDSTETYLADTATCTIIVEEAAEELEEGETITETITFSELGYENAGELSTVEGDYVTLTFSVGTGSTTPKYYTSGTAARLYANNTLNITSDYTITEIVFTYVSSSYTPDSSDDFTVDEGSYDVSTCTWTGSTTSVTFTNASSSQIRITSIEITISNSGKEPANLAFSEDEIEVAYGDEFTSPTFTYDTDATITFSSDNEDVATVDATGVITLAGGTGTAVISAVCDSTETYSADSTACTITVYTYKMYAKADTLIDGKEYLLVAQRDSETNYAYPITESYSYGYLNVNTVDGYVDTIKVNDEYEDGFIFTAADDDTWYMQDVSTNRYYYQSGTYNSFQVSESAPDAAYTIEKTDSGTFVMTCNDYIVQWGNSSYTTFAMYTSMQDNAVLPYLYELVEDDEDENDDESDDESDGISNVTTTESAAYDVYTISGMRVMSTTNSADINALPKGIYIINGKKAVVK